jgi:cyclin-dependent kinase-like
MDQLALIVACFGHLPNRLLAKALTNPQLVGVQLRTGNPRNWAVALQQR